MNFTSAQAIEQITYQMRLADYPRSLNRSRINSLANGSPPYTEEEEKRNNIEINVSDLSMTRLAHDARGQLYNGFFKPGNFFTGRTDGGPTHKRQLRGVVFTRELNRKMRKSLRYYECQRSKFALNVLHGIGPGCWEDRDHWCPEPLGVEDILMPSNTKLSFSNLPFFAIWRGYTGEELRRLTRGQNVDPGWNMNAVEKVIAWAESETHTLKGTAWSEYWSPEKREERIKQDSGIYASDMVQTIDCFDFYFWNDEGKKSGWNRRIILDAFGGYQAWRDDYGPNKKMPEKNRIGEKGTFLYDSGNRKWASGIGEILHCQFADLSAVGPFRYHNVRSLGFMLYSVCHLQNRLRCKFQEAVMENLMMYLRVKSTDDAERALKIELASRGIIDESVQFLSPGERWQPNPVLSELGLNELKQIVQDNSGAWTQNQNFSRDRVEKTRFQVMAEVNAMTALISSALQQAYHYQGFEYEEILRRFCKKDSRDPDVRDFRARCLAQDVPQSLMVPEAWEVEPERVMGAGNKTLEMAITQQLMEWRAAYSPEAQTEILRMATLALTDSSDIALQLVPETAHVSDSKQAGMFGYGSMMAGAIVSFKDSQNRIEIIEILLAELTLAVRKVLRSGGMTTQDKVAGFQNVAAHITQLIAQAGADKAQAERIRTYNDSLGQLTNQIKAFAQRLAEQTAQGNGHDAELELDIYKEKVKTDVKAANTRESHAQRTAQRQVQFELEQRRKDTALEADLKRQLMETQVDVAATDLETSAKIRRESSKPDKT